MISHELKLYVFREPYVRLSSEKFTFNNLQEKFVHLTNNALQKYSETYNEDATLKDIGEFEMAVRDEYKADYDFRKESWIQMINIIKITFESARKNINENNKGKQLKMNYYILF